MIKPEEVKTRLQEEIQLLELGLLEESEFRVLSYGVSISEFSAALWVMAHRLLPDFRIEKIGSTEYRTETLDLPGPDPRDWALGRALDLAKRDGLDLVICRDNSELWCPITRSLLNK